jgi:Tfp pilus assembly protein PilX
MNSCPSERYPAKSQAGMVLLLCLLFLTALTLLGLSASADVVLQNQLAANLQESERARQSALAALTWAEDWLLELQGTAPEPCLTPCEGFKLHPSGNLLPHPEFEDLSWWRTQGYEAGIDPLTGNRLVSLAANNVNPPMWIVEVVHEIPASDNGSTDALTDALAWYRIVARGNGQTDTAISVVESIVEKSWPAADSTNTSNGGRVSWRELR